ncbi:hypothetical protein GGQ68_002640 [Sagittula marina]|uniref:SH3b domain-containing protein n=1 Tax=Sagittula marina TaxID=943940 RepID=A0A7W6DNB9_9RHOB|nr:SH3 domain-containing protein [Sagittula marina]MBB3986301.1 hypothetical protein [Sagittula marina]
MVRLFLVTFGLLGWAWFELSGGTSFVPGENGVQLVAIPDVETPASVQVAAAPAETPEIVARDTPADLNAVVMPAVAARPAQVKTVYAPSAGDAVITPASMTAAMPSDESDFGIDVSRPAEIEATVATAAVVDYREVTASRVNLRGGPSTNYNVLTQLLRGEEVEVIDDTGAGWVKLRALDGNDIGWMADSFLTASN